MTMPRFSAEASLYETNEHYRTGMQVIKLSVQTINPIRPALREQEGEVIHVHSCPPGFSDIGGSCWPIPLDEPPHDAGVGDGGPRDGGPPDGGGGGGNGDKPPKVCTPQLQDNCNELYRICREKYGVECMEGEPVSHCEARQPKDLKSKYQTCLKENKSAYCGPCKRTK